MGGKRRYVSAIGLSLLVIMATTFHSPVARAATTCSATVDPHDYSPAQTQDIQFTVTNTGSAALHWVQFAPPTLLIEPRAISSPGWAPTANTRFVELDDGVLPVGNTLNATVTVHTANIDTDPADWRIRASTTSDGTGAVSCSGDLNGQISGPLQDQTPPEISNISTSNPTDRSITIYWQTDEPASGQILYATQADYDPNNNQYNQQSSLDSNLTTDHAITLTNLSSDTDYHFAISSSDGSGNNTTSSDNTFLTGPPVADNSGTTTAPPPSTNQELSPPSPIPLRPENQREKVPPTVSLKTTASGAQATAPKFTGTAEDNDQLAKISYSTDDGQNWNLVTNVKGLGTKKATFDFTPTVSEDGNYNIKARAMDASANTAVTPAIVLVLDRLPPLVGNNVVTLGPQALLPAADGTLMATVGVDQKITVSAVGGPVSMSLKTKKLSDAGEQFISMTRSASTGLWSGIIAFQNPGRYQLSVTATDGAQNVRQRDLNIVTAVSSATVTDPGRGAINNARAELYYFDPFSQNWVIWDGGPYGQDNPQTTGKNGQLHYFLPAGRYYLKVSARYYRTGYSRIFELAKPTPLTNTIDLQPLPSLRFGQTAVHWPLISATTFNVATASGQKAAPDSPLVSHELPAFSLTNTNGQVVNSVDFRGRPTLVTFIDSWSPEASEQLPALEKLQTNPDLNIVPISTLESSAKLATFLTLGGHQLTMLSDPDGTLVEKFQLKSAPTHLLVNRRGVVAAVVTGVLSESELLARLTALN